MKLSVVNKYHVACRGGVNPSSVWMVYLKEPEFN